MKQSSSQCDSSTLLCVNHMKHMLLQVWQQWKAAGVWCPVPVQRDRPQRMQPQSADRQGARLRTSVPVNHPRSDAASIGGSKATVRPCGSGRSLGSEGRPFSSCGAMVALVNMLHWGRELWPSLTVTYGHLQSLTVTYGHGHLRSLTVTYGHLQSLTVGDWRSPGRPPTHPPRAAFGGPFGNASLAARVVQNVTTLAVTLSRYATLAVGRRIGNPTRGRRGGPVVQLSADSSTTVGVARAATCG
eukprot:2348381-Pyramimonas_sp.AAC.1